MRVNLNQGLYAFIQSFIYKVLNSNFFFAKPDIVVIGVLHNAVL